MISSIVHILPIKNQHDCNEVMVVLKNTAHNERYLRGIFDKEEKNNEK